MQYDDSAWGLLEANRSSRGAIHENSARPARQTATWTTTGIGEILVPTQFAFNLRFIEEPCFTSGITLGGTINPVAGHFPRAGAGVYDWHLDNRGYYVGAFLFFTVDTAGPGSTPGEEPNYVIVHHLRWEGKAVKDLPDHLLDF